MTLFNLFNTYCDAPQPWGVYFQDSATPQMEALVELHDNIMFYLVIILFGVAWIMVSIIRNYVNTKSPISNKYLNHGTSVPTHTHYKTDKCHKSNKHNTVYIKSNYYTQKRFCSIIFFYSFIFFKALRTPLRMC